MARIAGVDLPKNKRMEIALTYIYGIGRTKSKEILREAGVDLDTKTDQLADSEITAIKAGSLPVKAACKSVFLQAREKSLIQRSSIFDEHQGIIPILA